MPALNPACLAWGAGRDVNLAVVKEDHTPGKLPFMLVRVCQFVYRNRMPSLVVHDPSGQSAAVCLPAICTGMADFADISIGC